MIIKDTAAKICF